MAAPGLNFVSFNVWQSNSWSHSSFFFRLWSRLEKQVNTSCICLSALCENPFFLWLHSLVSASCSLVVVHCVFFCILRLCLLFFFVSLWVRRRDACLIGGGAVYVYVCVGITQWLFFFLVLFVLFSSNFLFFFTWSCCHFFFLYSSTWFTNMRTVR